MDRVDSVIVTGGPRLDVLCTGLDNVQGFYEYVFLVSHPCGCSWKVKRRYSDLLKLHEQLSAMVETLPAFPPKWNSFGQHLTSSSQDVATQRVVALQRYLRLLARDRATARLPAVLATLGVEAPETVRSVRVLCWNHEDDETSVEMDVQPSSQGENSSRPVESYEVDARNPFGDELRKTVANIDQPVCVSGLIAGEEVEISVRARNAVGTSPPIAIRLMVPAPLAISPADSMPSSSDNHHAQPSRCLPPGEPPPGENCDLGFLELSQVQVGSRVLAVWAGDRTWYDAVVRHVHREGWVTVDWLRPAPLSCEDLRCVCDAGGDDTAHRRVISQKVRLRGKAPTENKVVQDLPMGYPQFEDVRPGGPSEMQDVRPGWEPVELPLAVAPNGRSSSRWGVMAC